MSRALLMVMDSFGIGGAPDAARFDDEGSDTLGHIVEACAVGLGDKSGVRQGPLKIPNMERLGLGHAWHSIHKNSLKGFDVENPAEGLWAAAYETSNGKDTPSGHWEIAGVPVTFNWGYFPDQANAFPADFVSEFLEKAGLPGLLCGTRSSGIVVLETFGEEHIRTGKPICYTSADSVFQIAAHEQHFGLERLYEICEIARELLYPLNIGRVIARPFVGETKTSFERTANRRDYSILPPAPTLLDRLKEAGRQVIAIGKISDIFAHQGVTKSIKAAGNMSLFDATLTALDEAGDGDLIFVNFVDFDTLYGHRRDVPGYAAALEAFDLRLPELYTRMKPGDLAILTADHGCDPTWQGTEHTREQVPFLAFGPNISPGPVDQEMTFSDIGETVAKHLGIEQGPVGKSIL